jgi:hypothetical protein
VEQPLLDRPEQEKHEQDEDGGEDGGNVKAETDTHADRRHHPDRGCCCQAVDLVALAQNGAGAQEADASHHLGRDAGRVGSGAEYLETEAREQAGANSDQAEGFDSRRMAVEFALETNRDGEDGGDEESEREVGVARKWQGCLTFSGSLFARLIFGFRFVR